MIYIIYMVYHEYVYHISCYNLSPSLCAVRFLGVQGRRSGVLQAVLAPAVALQAWRVAAGVFGRSDLTALTHGAYQSSSNGGEGGCERTGLIKELPPCKVACSWSTRSKGEGNWKVKTWIVQESRWWSWLWGQNGQGCFFTELTTNLRLDKDISAG